MQIKKYNNLISYFPTKSYFIQLSTEIDEISMALSAAQIKEKFVSSKIVPEVIDEAPSSAVQVKYPNGKQVNFGAELTPTEVKDEPSLQWDADPQKLYTVLMVDPDVPDSIKDGALHWLVYNIKGNDLSTGIKKRAPYSGSGAPKGTGLHRYIFFVFEQNGPIDPNVENTFEGRTKFSTKHFVQKYGLKGRLVAGNYFNAQWDEYADILRDNWPPKA